MPGNAAAGQAPVDFPGGWWRNRFTDGPKPHLLRRGICQNTASGASLAALARFATSSHASCDRNTYIEWRANRASPSYGKQCERRPSMPDSGLAGGCSDGAPGRLPSIPDDSRPDAGREAALTEGVRMPARLERRRRCRRQGRRQGARRVTSWRGLTLRAALTPWRGAARLQAADMVQSSCFGAMRSSRRSRRAISGNSAHRCRGAAPTIAEPTIAESKIAEPRISTSPGGPAKMAEAGRESELFWTTAPTIHLPIQFSARRACESLEYFCKAVRRGARLGGAGAQRGGAYAAAFI